MIGKRFVLSPLAGPNREKGQVLALGVVMMVGLVGVAALAVDVGYFFVTRNQLQNVADGSALAATRTLGNIYQGIPYPLQQGFTCNDACAETIRTAEGQVRIEERFVLADFLKTQDLFSYGMVPQFMARFDKTVMLSDLSSAVLQEILLHAYDSPFIRSQRYFETMRIALEIEDLAAALIAEEATKESRTGARALRSVFAEIINPFEFDPWSQGHLEETDGGWRLRIDAQNVRQAIQRQS